jgi:transposase
MGARLRIFLTAEEDRTLLELRAATTVPQRVKDRADVLRLNAQGWYVEKIAAYLHWHPQTVRDTLHRWQKQGLGGLWEGKGRGSKPRWQAADLAHLEACLRQDEQIYNSHQLSQKLATDRQVKLSPDHLRRVLKKRESFRSEPVLVIASVSHPNNAPSNKPI